MNPVILWLRRVAVNPYLPFVLIFVLMLGLHALLPMNLMDDRYYTRMTEKSALLPYLVKTYSNWSSRLVILSVVRGMLGFFPSIVWRLLNPAAFALLGFFISRICSPIPNRRVNWFIAALLLAYPFIDMRSAGWVTTSLNYLWVLTFGLYNFHLLFKLLRGQKVRIWEYLLAIPALLYAANQEQMSIISLAVFAGAVIVFIIRKQAYWFPIAGLALSAAGLIFALTSPGNAIRRVVETSWFLDFERLSIIDKFEIGLSSTLDRYIFQPNLLFLLLSVLLMVVIWRKYRQLLLRVLALIPLFSALFFGIFSLLDVDLFPELEDISSRLTTHGFVTLENFTRVSSYVPLAILCVVFGVVLVLLLVSYKDSCLGLSTAAALVLGLASRVMMGFSPTVWASAARTHLFMYAAIILCCALLFRELVDTDEGAPIPALLTVAGFTGAFAFLNLLMTL